ncbi:MAG: protein kinase [Myxococcales bacterium]|nr:protein kinase [Myxococcales bacterium]
MKVGVLAVMLCVVAGCTAARPASEVTPLEQRVDSGPRSTARSMSEIRGAPGSRGVDVWAQVTPPASCDDPALLLTNATTLAAAEVDGRAVDVLRRPYGLVPLPSTPSASVHLALRGRVERTQGRLLVGCGRDLLSRWLLLDVVQFVIGAALLIAAAFVGAAALARGRRAVFGWLALFLLSIGWVCFAQSPGYRNLLFVQAVWISWLRDLFAFVYVLAFARFVAVVFGDTRRRFFARISLLIAGVAAAAVALDLARLVGLRTSFVVSQLFALSLLPVAIAHVWARARGGDRSARRFLIGAVALLICAAPDLFWGLGLSLHFEFNTAPIGLLLFAAALGSIVQLQFEARTLALESQSRELAARVHELEGKQREIRGLSGELRHQIGQRSRELGRALLGAAGHEGVGVARLAPGQVLGRYRVVRELGAGAMGAVYEVERKSDGEHLALKVMSAAGNPALAARFAREAEIAARVQHPNIVGITDIDVLPSGSPFLVMELVRGVSLEDQRSRFGDVPWALSVLSELGAGLEALHAAGVVHRDLKPSNVLLDDQGAVKVADFGIAREQETTLGDTAVVGSAASEAEAANAAAARVPSARLTHTGALIGTPLYMAPELGTGSVASPASDVFAFGLIAHELLSGAHPFAKPPVLLAMAGVPLPPPPALDQAAVPEAVRELVAAALSPDPERRPSARLIALGLVHALRTP